ncbi:MAG: GAF domain-containing sensor histidine kinase [Acidimicrobiia bacterium]|nr:GAF domain-containing sensor histidine kinase [Acidimicrobiia bacterium]
MRVMNAVPPIPQTEAARLTELETFEILDTLPEQAYDAITKVAAYICDAPIALISIVDADRQWFKSTHGLDVSETPRDIAFCPYAIMNPQELMVVPDATADERFSSNPLVTGDPEIRFYAGAPLVTRSGNALGTLCVIDRTARDLTPDQRQALEALSVQVMALLDLRRTYKDLEATHQQLRDVMRQRDTFIATVSHEIRTPLTAVIGYIGLLADPNAGLSPEERAELMATVGRQAGEVSHMIDDLLMAAKAESGSLSVTAVNVNLAAQTAQVLEGLDQGRAQDVDVRTEHVRAIGDPARVRQVIRNLVTNAFRYGGEDVSIGTFVDGNRCGVEVSDNGAAIPNDSLEKIFSPFEKSSTGPVVSGSIGLGLPISRLLAERMSGSLNHLRRHDRTVFQLELPTAPD